ncbi:MAG: ATP-dependent Clp protease adaptor ClpS [Bacteroidetes bacterium]|nr:ATP-dependent Clp protease adaptor ClpS [Bacteroidota bacterium]
MKYHSKTHEETESDILTSITGFEEYELVLYNDDVNTFDHVINCLIKYCQHDVYQAEQCAWIVHTKGKCVIKSGEYSLLEPICTALSDQGLSAQIELL